MNALFAAYRACISGLLLVTSVCAGAVEHCATPLPSDVRSPAQEASEGVRAFIGTWGNGKWDGVLCHTLVVEEVPSSDTAIVVYSHGVFYGWNIRAPGFYRVNGSFEGETLLLSFPSIDARAEYRIIDGKLHGKYFTGGQVASIVLTRK